MANIENEGRDPDGFSLVPIHILNRQMKETVHATPKLHSLYVYFHCHFLLIMSCILPPVISNYEGEARWGLEENEEKKK